MQHQPLTIRQKADKFLESWHSFPIDFWWRKKYNVPFGSKQHREMNFIDMLIEYQEDLNISKKISKSNDVSDEDYESVGYYESDGGETMSQAEIDKDFEDLKLSEFDIKQ